ncbi:hypothetical protein RHMOL_Rhmol08G0300300 [Rhododendron molle]|uniref:Uncharacterized protein n=1 Tax=Rhododendron molle TaxID=49168 RepID=A0ACC0MV72_RHOML|nr:hypothetical protein RHMOL_Rhmol08G0300300 [Rhododendron molle]
MGTLQLLNPHCLASRKALLSHNFSTSTGKLNRPPKSIGFSRRRRRRIRAVATIPDGEPEIAEEAEETPAVNFAFVHSVLLPDGTPDVHFRTACGGQKLRDIMLDANMELYGPYVVEGKELLTPRTDKEKEKLKRNPKNWRLACQVTVGKPDSRGLVVIQQLPEWKGHQWEYNKEPPPELEEP